MAREVEMEGEDWDRVRQRGLTWVTREGMEVTGCDGREEVGRERRRVVQLFRRRV